MSAQTILLPLPTGGYDLLSSVGPPRLDLLAHAADSSEGAGEAASGPQQARWGRVHQKTRTTAHGCRPHPALTHEDLTRARNKRTRLRAKGILPLQYR